ncbi:MAG: DUF5752 family protein [Myxococcota bacterium]|nr:DUF5752 family protein [Myxococcota bacterium]
MEPFVFHDAHVLRVATGRSVVNLRELLAALRDCDAGILRHHLFRFPLDPAYDFSAYGHELAWWAENGLQDAVLAERLGNFDPYDDPEPEALRAALLDIVEDHLMSIAHVPWARPGRELHLMRSIVVAYPVGREAGSLAELRDAILVASRGSLYYHFFEARTRLAGRVDDFSAWIASSLGRPDVVAAIRRIDSPALRIDGIRDEVARILAEEAP